MGLAALPPAVLSATTSVPTNAPTSLGADFQSGHGIITLITIALVVTCVMIHYEVLKVLTRALAHLHTAHRTRVLVLIWGLLLTHLLEIWIYGFACFALDGRADFGHLTGVKREGLPDHIYFSFVTYTTVGYGDIVPVGPIRFLSALEALSGWVLIGWSTSFTFLEMQRFWRNDNR